jgi:hypothetical protein
VSDKPIGDSVQDFGSTQQFAGSVNTSVTNIPSVAGDPIASCLIRNAETSGSKRLLYSLDGTASVFHSLGPGEWISYPTKGNVSQIQIKGSVSSVNYEVTLNREPT